MEPPEQTPADGAKLKWMQNHVAKLTRLENDECLRACATSLFEFEWSNILVVTPLSSTNSSLVNIYVHEAMPSSYDLGWVCHGNFNTHVEFRYMNTADSALLDCDTNFILADSQSWAIPDVPACPTKPAIDNGIYYFPNMIEYNVIDGSNDCEADYNAPIKYCLAERFPGRCTVNISTRLLSAVIICNAIKTCCMLTTLGLRSFRPLANIGGAIASFLENPDPRTYKKGALEISTVSSGIWDKLDKYTPLPWTRQRRRWWYAIARPQWYMTVSLCLAAWIAGIIAFTQSFEHSANHVVYPKSSRLSTFGAADTYYEIKLAASTGLVSDVVLVNTPQLIISLIYVFYNDAFSRTLMSHEYALFATIRKPLRVSSPCGQQRSTYWLQLPYKYALPMLSCMALLHWLVSRSIYLVKIEVFDKNGRGVPSRNQSGCGYSPLAILLACCLGTVMIGALFAVGFFRHLDSGMPVISSCSVATSAAAQPAPSEPVDISTLPVRYGVIPGTKVVNYQYGKRSEEGDPGNRSLIHGLTQHVSFSSLDVAPLKSDILYW